MSADTPHEELTTPVRCPRCEELTVATEGTCVHCGAPLTDIIERRAVEISITLDDEDESDIPSHRRRTLDLTRDAARQFAKLTIEEEPGDTVGVRVQKVESEDASLTPRRRYGEFECPFDKGDVVFLEIGGVPRELKLIKVSFSSQLATGFFAIDVDDYEDLKRRGMSEEAMLDGPAPYFLEVYVSGNEPQTGTFNCQLFRMAVAAGKYRGKPFRVYDESDSLSLEAVVEQAERQLPFEEVVAIFRSVLDLSICAHSSKSLVFGISPWTVRLLNDPSECEECRISEEDRALQEEGASVADVSDLAENKVRRSDAAEETTEVMLTDEEDDSDAPSLDIPSCSEKLADDAEPLPESLYRSVFDGLERLYPFGEMPESVPMVPGFVASEFLLGMTQMVGEQADVFSLGCLLYYLVTGHVPPSSVHTSYSPALPMRNFRPDFPLGLEAVVHRATRVQPSERYQTVRELRSDFEHAVGQINKREYDRKNTRNYSVVRAAVDKHIGIAKGKRMPVNQDNVFCGVVDTGRLALVVIADGVTRATYGRGDIASGYVTEAAAEVWKDVEAEYMERGTFNADEAVDRILTGANDRLVNYVNEHYYPFSGGLHEVMGSTVIIACVEDGNVTLATLGDSRAYLSTDIGLEQLTVDHNLWTLNVLEGALPVERVRSMPFADALARCVGSFRVVDHRLEALPPEPDIHRFFLHSGDRLLISTDGLTDYVGINRDSVEDAIHSVLLREPDPAIAALELILLANRGGGGDNIGVGVIDFH